MPSPKTAVGHQPSDSLKAAHLSGYAENEFSGKREQMLQVVEEIRGKGFIPVDLVETEVAWFYQ